MFYRLIYSIPEEEGKYERFEKGNTRVVLLNLNITQLSPQLIMIQNCFFTNSGIRLTLLIMTDQQRTEHYEAMIKEWVKVIRNSSEYFESFSYHTLRFKEINLPICFDDRAAIAILNLLDSLQFQSFSHQTHPNRARSDLFIIAGQLYGQGFIGRESLHLIRQKVSQCMLESKLQAFLQSSLEEASEKQVLRMNWQKYICIPIRDFWTWIVQQRIQHQILLQIYRCTIAMEEKLPSMVTESQCFQSLTKEYHRLYGCSQHRHRPQKASFSRQMYSNNKSVNDFLEKMAHKYSLFLNEDYRLVRKSTQHFIAQMTDLFFPMRQASFQPFGSFRSKMALSEDSDLDLTVIFKGKRISESNSSSIKEKDFIFLQELVKKTDISRLKWLDRLNIDQKSAPVTYMKLSLDSQRFQEEFGILSLTKIDVTVENYNAIRNSQFLLQFAERREVLQFCILVKKWAKYNNIINMSQPMSGLSSYAVIQMCLFFLMETKQIDFAAPNSRESVQRCQMLSLQENFTRFLQFYGKDGRFKASSMMICLIQGEPNREIYNEGLIINIYDHLDNSNSGRLTKKYEEWLDYMLLMAFRTMQSKDIGKIASMFMKTS